MPCRRAVGGMRGNLPVIHVENHPQCRKNEKGEAILPDEQAWRPKLLISLLATKLMSDVQKALRQKGSIDPREAQQRAMRRMMQGRKALNNTELLDQLIETTEVTARMACVFLPGCWACQGRLLLTCMQNPAL